VKKRRFPAKKLSARPEERDEISREDNNQREATMRHNSTAVDLLIGAALKLDPRTGERQNVLAFIQSCYCGRVRNYDLGAALASLTHLTDEEQCALITWVVTADEPVARRRAG
jgi:hypothetical protein